MLKVLSKEDCEKIRCWRNEQMYYLRTPFLLTKEMQEDFYEKTICNRYSPNRYWGVYEKDQLVGITGIVTIQWENQIGEITLVLNPEITGQGIGTKAVDEVLDKAFNELNLRTVCGECYESNSALGFWKKITEKYNGKTVTLPNRKFYKGRFWDSFYFSIDVNGFNLVYKLSETQISANYQELREKEK